MTHEPKMSRLLDDYLQGLMNDDQLLEFENQLEEDPQLQEDLMLIQEIEAAISETDTNQLRMQIKSVMNHETISSEKLTAQFNLAEETFLEGFVDQLPLNQDIIEYLEALPKIHIENHHRNDAEVLHQVYKDQQKITEVVEDEDDFMSGDEWFDMEEAIQEKDIMNLRESLKQIQVSVHAHNYSIEEMESYMEGTMTSNQLGIFEEELTVNAALNADVELLFDLDEALSETDIFELRESVQLIMAKETSSSHSLSEIESFIYDELDDEIRDSLANEIYENDDLRAELNLIRELDEALAEKDILKLRDELRSLSVEMSVTEEKSIIPFNNSAIGLKRLASVAAVLLMILGSSLMIRFLATPSGSLSDLYNDSPIAVTSFRSAVPDVSSQLSSGFELYNNNDFNGALNYFRKVLEVDNDNPAALFYSGASHQNLDEFGKAVKEYKNVIEHNDNIFVEQAEWYMGLCLIQLNEKQKAMAVLEAIISRDGFYQEKAEVLLKKLKRKG
jgi:tetratricopeptide (TPR) repeat protein